MLTFYCYSRDNIIIITSYMIGQSSFSYTELNQMVTYQACNELCPHTKQKLNDNTNNNNCNCFCTRLHVKVKLSVVERKGASQDIPNNVAIFSNTSTNRLWQSIVEMKRTNSVAIL